MPREQTFIFVWGFVSFCISGVLDNNQISGVGVRRLLDQEISNLTEILLSITHLYLGHSIIWKLGTETTDED